MGTFLSVVVAVITIACRTDAAPGTSVTTTRVAIEFINTDMLPFFIARGLGDGYSNPSLFVERAEADGVVVTLEEHTRGGTASKTPKTPTSSGSSDLPWTSW